MDINQRYKLGQPVHVHAFGAWRAGTVTRLGRSRVWVRFVRNRFDDTHEKPFLAAEVLDAAGVALTSARELRPGQVVLVANARRTVKSVQPPRRRRVEIRYSDGEQVTLYARTRVRVATSPHGGS